MLGAVVLESALSPPRFLVGRCIFGRSALSSDSLSVNFAPPMHSGTLKSLVVSSATDFYIVAASTGPLSDMLGVVFGKLVPMDMTK